MKHLLHLLCLTFLLTCTAMAAVPPGTDTSQLNKGGVIEKNYRDRAFRAYKPTADVCRELRVSSYSSFENPTGIYCEKGDKISLKVSGYNSGELQLILRNFEKEGGHTNFPLRNGNNSYTVSHNGLLYINYRHRTPQQAPAVRISISGGHVNGIFTQHDDESTWKSLLENAKGNILDIIGERVQLAFAIDQLKRKCPVKGPKLLRFYETMIFEQQKMMGWEKYNHHPGNHIFGRVIWNGYMHADGLGAAAHHSVLNTAADPDFLTKNGGWGMTHEFGHVNQVRPGFKWIGTTEITNNLYSLWMNYLCNPKGMRLEHQMAPNADGKSMRGGNMDRYINLSILKHELWRYTDAGSINTEKHEIPCGNVFIALAPFWQLQLYFTVARENADFYPMVFEAARKVDPDTPHGEIQLHFIRSACKAANMNLADYFLNVGMLCQINRVVGDYGKRSLVIDKEMCRDTLTQIIRYPEPDSSVIHYICVNNVDIYKNKKPVRKAKKYRLKRSGNTVTISPTDCQNAVAYEAWDGNKLVRVALRGLNHEDDSTTDLTCPDGTDKICAVQWDGKRIILWKK